MKYTVIICALISSAAFAMVDEKKPTRSVELKTEQEEVNGKTIISTKAYVKNKEIGHVTASIEQGCCKCPKKKKSFWSKLSSCCRKKNEYTKLAQSCDCACGENCACIKPKATIQCRHVIPVFEKTELEKEMINTTKQTIVALGCPEETIKIQTQA